MLLAHFHVKMLSLYNAQFTICDNLFLLWQKPYHFDSLCNNYLTSIFSSVLVTNRFVWFDVMTRNLYRIVDRLEWQIKKQRLQEKSQYIDRVRYYIGST